MYHEKTFGQIREHRRRRLLLALVVAVTAFALAQAVDAARDVVRSQATASVREAVLTCAIQCCAIEGSYPSTLAHLEETYGLVVNHDDYVVTYEWLGDNVVPSVVVRPR